MTGVGAELRQEPLGAFIGGSERDRALEMRRRRLAPPLLPESETEIAMDVGVIGDDAGRLPEEGDFLPEPAGSRLGDPVIAQR